MPGTLVNGGLQDIHFPKNGNPNSPKVTEFHFWERFWENGRRFPDRRFCEDEEEEL